MFCSKNYHQRFKSKITKNACFTGLVKNKKLGAWSPHTSFASRCAVFFFFKFENKNFDFFISTIIYCVIFTINITLGTASFILLCLPLGFLKTILSPQIPFFDNFFGLGCSFFILHFSAITDFEAHRGQLTKNIDRSYITNENKLSCSGPLAFKSQICRVRLS